MEGRILILEDDQAFAEMLVESLDANGIDAEVSLDPFEALEKVRSGTFDLLVSDYLMPKLEGTAFIRQVREFNEAIPVVMISAYMGEAEMRQAAQVGVTRVLRKPFEMNELIGEIQQLFAAHGTRSGTGRSGGQSGGEFSFPGPLRFLRAGSHGSKRWIQHLWEASRSESPVFLVGEPGFELDLIVAELAGWMEASEGEIAFDFQASELLSSRSRTLIGRFAGKDSYSRVVIGRGLDEMERSQQKVIKQMLERSDGYLRQGGGVSFVFPLSADRLTLAEMSMDEELLEMVFGNLVKVPPLRGRYPDIAAYLAPAGAEKTEPIFSPEAAAFLLRYEWPGNYDQLMELRRRLALGRPGVEWSESEVRAALEKRLTEPLDAEVDFTLAAVLRARQGGFLESLAQSGNGSPAEILHRAGCPDASPAPNFPSGQELLYPGLLDSAVTD